MSRVDWAEIHRILEDAGAAAERVFTGTAEDRERVLKKRADLLALEPEKKTDEKTIEVVEFRLSQERYGIESRYVREVCALREYTPVPCAPAFVLGLINVRGQIISVIDLKRFFEIPAKGIGELNRVVIVRDETMEFGILADEILGVSNVGLKELKTSLPTLTGIRDEFLRGVTGECLVILDGDRLLSSKKLIVHEEVRGMI